MRNEKVETAVANPATRLRARDAARHLGIAPATLAKYRCLGGGPQYVKLNRAVVYEVADLDAWVRAHGKQRTTSDRAVTQ